MKAGLLGRRVPSSLPILVLLFLPCTVPKAQSHPSPLPPATTGPGSLPSLPTPSCLWLQLIS